VGEVLLKAGLAQALLAANLARPYGGGKRRSWRGKRRGTRGAIRWDARGPPMPSPTRFRSGRILPLSDAQRFRQRPIPITVIPSYNRALGARQRENAIMADNKPDNPVTIRRVITGHDANQRAVVVLDGPAANYKRAGHGGVSTMMWCTDAMPADIATGEDMGARMIGTPPPPNGTRFAVIEFPAGAPGRMHRTETLDYVIVMSGEIDMDLDDSSVHLKAGDVLIQNGTNHSWVNRGTEPCRVAFVLIDGVPLGIGQPVVRGQNTGAP
jgi:quercetin dioxygenase-like cupin family protein